MLTAERTLWREAYALLDRFLELPAHERASQLDGLDASAEIKARLERLLEAMESGAGPLESTPSDLFQRSISEHQSLSGRSIGEWQLQEEIGRGGMAVVYRSLRRTADVEQVAAVKLLRFSFLDEASRRRFHREQQILASLQHPNIAKLIEGGVAEDGTPYMALEYIEGERIDEFCEAHHLSTAECVQKLAEVCDAVAFAHRNLVVHRDIKTSNILVDADGNTRLLDFGIAKLLEEEAQRQTSTRIMTPEYAAPEQFRGERVTTATDVFGLGIVLYRLLCSGFPFKSEQDVDRGELDLSASRELDADLRNILLMALRPEPDRRYADADAFGSDLRRWLSHRPVIATPDTPGYRLKKFVGRNRGPVLASALAAVSLLVGAGIAISQAREARIQARTATKEARKAQAIGDFLIGLFESSGPSNTQGEDLRASDIVRRGYEQLDQALEDQPGIRGDLLRTIGSIQSELGLYDDARVSLDKAIDSHREDPLALTQAIIARCKLDMAQGAYAKSESRLLAHQATLTGSGCGVLCDAMVASSLAEAQALLSRLDDASATANKALAAMNAQGLEEPSIRINLHRALGIAKEEQGDMQAAAKEWRKAIALERDRTELPTTDLAALYTDLGITLGKIGALEESEQALSESVELNRKLVGENSALYASSLQNLALNYYFQDRVSDSAAMLTKARAIKLSTVGIEHPGTAVTIYNLGRLEHVLGNLEASEALLVEGRAALLESLGPRHHVVASVRGLYGHLLLELGRLDEAEAETRLALEIFIENQPPEHPDIAQTKIRLSRVLIARNRLDEADVLLKESAPAIAQAKGEHDAGALEARIARAEWHRARLETEAAARLVEEVRSHIDADSERDRPLWRATEALLASIRK
ncbi:MAG: serine/threonine-protein kinase [Myxococcota bacterium]